MEQERGEFDSHIGKLREKQRHIEIELTSIETKDDNTQTTKSGLHFIFLKD
jgi:hypothetical protein